MTKTWTIILAHQLFFQGMFVAKNILLRKKIGRPIRGKNREATISIAFFVLFIAAALTISFYDQPIGRVALASDLFAGLMAGTLLLVNLAISAASLLQMKDSWRVGVFEEQQTDLVTTGIYKLTRNPYFVSYDLMFVAYTILLQNALLLLLSVAGLCLVHWMIRKEEAYLGRVHGKAYERYQQAVPRYILF